MEEMALNYFRSLEIEDRKELIKKILDILTEEEKVEIAKLLIGKE